MSEPAALLVFISCPTAMAESLAESLIHAQLAACVSLLPGMRSVYRWNGSVERADETLLIAKTSVLGYPALEAAVKAQHPYELPEIVAVDIACGLPAYLQWLNRSVP